MDRHGDARWGLVRQGEGWEKAGRDMARHGEVWRGEEMAWLAEAEFGGARSGKARRWLGVVGFCRF